VGSAVVQSVQIGVITVIIAPSSKTRHSAVTVAVAVAAQ